MEEIEKLNNAIAYARRLEEIIEAAPLDVNTRILVNALVGNAKEKHQMYNNN